MQIDFGRISAYDTATVCACNLRSLGITLTLSFISKTKVNFHCLTFWNSSCQFISCAWIQSALREPIDKGRTYKMYRLHPLPCGSNLWHTFSGLMFFFIFLLQWRAIQLFPSGWRWTPAYEWYVNYLHLTMFGCCQGLKMYVYQAEVLKWLDQLSYSFLFLTCLCMISHKNSNKMTSVLTCSKCFGNDKNGKDVEDLKKHQGSNMTEIR